MESQKTLPDFACDMNAVLGHKTSSWLNGIPPDYSNVNDLYMKERIKTLEPGSIEAMITNIIKNWEKELAHKTNPADWVTIKAERFRMAVNGEGLKGIPEIAFLGAYNVFIGDTEFYCASKVQNPNISNKIFRDALPAGFAWEVIEVYSQLPKVALKWRHWGKMDGPLKCPMRSGREIEVKGNGRRVEIFGMTTMTLDGNYQILEMEHFFRPDQLLEQMVAGETI